MLVQKCWLSSLLFIIGTIALSTSSSHQTSISSTKKSTVTSSSTHHTSTSTIEKSTASTSSTHRTSSSSTRSTTATPTSVPSTFYLVAENTRESQFDGYYFKIIVAPYPDITTSGAKALQFGGKTSQGAANFSLNADGALRCNDVSGPLYAGVSYGHPYTQTLEFEYFANPEYVNRYDLVTATCAIAADAVLTCQWGPLVDFYYDDSNIVNGTQVGEIVGLGVAGESIPFTIKVVPT